MSLEGIASSGSLRCTGPDRSSAGGESSAHLQKAVMIGVTLAIGGGTSKSMREAGHQLIGGPRVFGRAAAARTGAKPLIDSYKHKVLSVKYECRGRIECP
jgi:hypothetical protein